MEQQLQEDWWRTVTNFCETIICEKAEVEGVLGQGNRSIARSRGKKVRFYCCPAKIKTNTTEHQFFCTLLSVICVIWHRWQLTIAALFIVHPGIERNKNIDMSSSIIFFFLSCYTAGCSTD